MKKTIFLLMSICMVIMPMKADVIEPYNAEQLVRDFITDLDHEGIGHYTLSHLLTVNSTNDPSKPLLYIYNANCLSGIPGRFVIVAGDSRARQVLAYGDGLLDINNIPDGLQDMIDLYMAQLEHLVFNPGEQLRYPADGYYDASPDAIGPLLTTTWGQHEPYNLLAPMANDTQRCPTGCASTALSMILHYHGHANLVEPIPAYETNTHHYQLPELEPMEFSWDMMRDSYTAEDDCTEEEELAVATLMRYVGQAQKMDYAIGGSGAFTSNITASIKRFGYTSQYLLKSDYDDQDWEDMLLTELLNDRPVLYCASSNVNHAFVIDGFDGIGKYHMNWGWNGDGNCYCELSALTPANSSSVYDQDHLMFIGIKPAPKEISVDEEWLEFCEYTGYSQTQTFTVSGLNLNHNVTLQVHDVEGPGSFTVTPSVITPAEAATGKTIEVTFTPWDNGEPSAVITLSSNEIEPVDVPLYGYGIKSQGYIIPDTTEYWITDTISDNAESDASAQQKVKRFSIPFVWKSVGGLGDDNQVMESGISWPTLNKRFDPDEFLNNRTFDYELEGDTASYRLGMELFKANFYDYYDLPILVDTLEFGIYILYDFQTLGNHDITMTITHKTLTAKPVVITIHGTAMFSDAMPYIFGDVNGDGKVDVSDVTALIDYVLGKSSTVNEQAADVNGDGVIDVSDVTMLIQYVLGNH